MGTVVNLKRKRKGVCKKDQIRKSGQAKGKTCYRCRSERHLVRECPLATQTSQTRKSQNSEIVNHKNDDQTSKVTTSGKVKGHNNLSVDIVSKM